VKNSINKKGKPSPATIIKNPKSKPPLCSLKEDDSADSPIEIKMIGIKNLVFSPSLILTRNKSILDNASG